MQRDVRERAHLLPADMCLASQNTTPASTIGEPASRQALSRCCAVQLPTSHQLTRTRRLLASAERQGTGGLLAPAQQLSCLQHRILDQPAWPAGRQSGRPRVNMLPGTSRAFVLHAGLAPGPARRGDLPATSRLPPHHQLPGRTLRLLADASVKMCCLQGLLLGQQGGVSFQHLPGCPHNTS